MATRMMSRGTTHVAGDRVSTSRSWFDKQTIDDFIGIDMALAKCNAIDAAAFPEHEQALRTLKSAVEKWTEQVDARPAAQHVE
jgi:hypothetical protein